MKKTITLTLFAALMVGCVSTPPPEPPQPTDQTFDAPKATVWPLVISEVSLKFPVKVVEKDSGLIQTDSVSVPPADMERWATIPVHGRWVSGASMVLGQSVLSLYERLRMNLTVIVSEPEPGKTHVTVRPHFEGFYNDNNITRSWVAFKSNGSLEHRMLTDIAAQLQKAQTPPPNTERGCVKSPKNGIG